MSTINYSDVIFVSIDDALQSTLVDLENLGFPATSWQPFSIPALYANCTAIFRSAVSEYAVFFKEIFIVETSYGEGLTRIVRSFYGLNRNPAVAAQIEVTLVCDNTSGPYTINLGNVVLTHSNGSTYRNVQDLTTVYPVTLPTSGTLTLLFESEIGGVKANIADALTSDQVTLKLQTTLAGISITAHTLERSGLDEESDARLTERAQLLWARNLPKLGLIDDGVKSSALEAAPAVVSVDVDSTNPRGMGTFDVYVAGLDAAASDQDVSLVQVAVDNQTFGRLNTPKTCQVYKSPTVNMDLAGIVYFSGTTPAIAKAAAEDALLAYTHSVPLGGFKYTPGPRNLVPINDVESVIREAVKSVANPDVTVSLTTNSNIPVPSHGKVIRGDWTGLVYQQVSL